MPLQLHPPSRAAFVSTAAPLRASTFLPAPQSSRVHLRPRFRATPRAPARARPLVLARAVQAPAAEPDHPLGPPGEPARLSPQYWTKGLRDDIRRRLPLYLSDWADGMRFKSLPVVLFLYFACLAPVVAFGGLTSALTAGSMGVVEFLLSSGASGMIYALLSAQPLTFISPTGLTLAFTTALFSFCRVAALPFLPTYAWVGVWTSLILAVAAFINASDLIKYCTRFTDDVFNSLIATNFVYEASRSLLGAFFVVGADKTNPFVALSLAIGTFLSARFLVGLRSSRFLFRSARNTLADFGPVMSIAVMSIVAALPAVARVGLPTLSIPATFSLAGGRAWLVPMLAVPKSVILISMFPAVLLTCLFFLDQNISVRVVNSPAHNLKKGPGYHLDILALALTTFLSSILGLPWMCAGTVQSLAHVRALAEFKVKDGKESIVSVQENRLTAFFVHAGILSSLFLLPVISKIPMAVISGLFLFLGASMTKGIEFLQRIPYLFMDPKLYPDDSPMKKIPARQVNLFTVMQLSCLTMLWVLKLNKKTSMLFPSVIATLMLIRSKFAPRIFPDDALKVLDSELVEPEEEPSPSASNGVAADCSMASSSGDQSGSG